MRAIVLCFSLYVFTVSLPAQQAVQRLVFEAASTSAAPQSVPTQLGADRAPDGNTIATNSQYLTLNGKPWIPVMGEFHFSRYPAAYWEEEILKMKASGVQVIATYVFWIHHEEVEGQFDWSGQRDLRQFAVLCQKHGMLLYPRIGPWAHGEVRNGGLPDWVMKKSAVRQNDPIYLAEVKPFYAQIGQQLHGLMWKDGGPVIGVQIENEYALNGPGQGRDHLAVLKQMAIESGFDVPLYTVTGWDNAVVPEDLFLPVYGGYPDAPWGDGTKVLPPAEVYAFRFASRVTGNMGALGGPAAISGGQSDRPRVAFLTAEVGGGMQDTYHRRPVLTPDDIVSMTTVVIGSGANQLGYYMFQGGENPDGKLSTMQESQRTGYPNDVPVKSYDFQAPLGEFGQMNAALKKLKLYHYFLNDFGRELAPSAVVQPLPKPENPEDLSVVRASGRLNGQHGFLFVNNYVREHGMHAWPGTQFDFKIAGKTLHLPATPITIPANSFFTWPINMDCGGTTLIYATAQPILKIKRDDDTYVFFQTIPGISAEFVFPAESRPKIHALRGTLVEEDGLVHMQNVGPGLGVSMDIHGASGVIHFMLLSPEAAGNLWRVTLHGQDQLVLTSAQVFSDGNRITLRQIGNPNFDVSVFPEARPMAGKATIAKAVRRDDGIFQHFAWKTKERKITPELVQTRVIGKAPEPLVGPKASWRTSAVAMTPEESSFSEAGEWRITVPHDALNGLSDVYLAIHYQGDQARLLSDQRLLTDDFYNGREWQIGLKRFLSGSNASVFTLQLLPLSEKAPIFFEPGTKPVMGKYGQAGSLQSVDLIPEYEVDISL